MVIRPDQAALEDVKEAFGGVGMDVPARIFLFAMHYRFVAGEFAPYLVINMAFIGHQVRVFGDVVSQNSTHVYSSNKRDMERAGFAAALNQRNNLVLVPAAALQRLSLDLAPVGFIGFHNLAAAAHRLKS